LEKARDNDPAYLKSWICKDIFKLPLPLSQWWIKAANITFFSLSPFFLSSPATITK
jgi:hypothetical protein